MVRNHQGMRSADALRWIFGLVVTSILASAVTSAVFLSVRTPEPTPQPIPNETLLAQQQWASLTPSLEAFARQRIANNQQQPAINVSYDIGMNQPAQRVPMVAPEDHALMLGSSTPWQLQIESNSLQLQFKRIVDIRKSTSLRHVGYFAVVEVEEIRVLRHHQLAGTLPFDPPAGYQVISTAEYTKLEERDDFNVQLASAEAEHASYVYDEWDPSRPPPAELPSDVKRQFNEAIVQCMAAKPATKHARKHLTYHYSLRKGKWMPLPQHLPCEDSPAPHPSHTAAISAN